MTQQSESHSTLQVHGEGQVQLKPDTAWIQLAVVTEGKTAGEALQANAERMNPVIARLRALGIGEKQMQTQGFNLYPIYNQADPPAIVGHRAENTLRVEVPVAQAGQVLDEGVGAGANQSGGLSFGLLDDSAPRAEALRLAVQAARRDAEAVAAAMGVRLRGTRGVEVLPGQQTSPKLFMDRAAAATPVLPGELTISAQVRIVYTY